MLSCSTDEGALVRAAENLGFVFSGRTPDCVIVDSVSKDVVGIDDELQWERDSPSVMCIAHSHFVLWRTIKGNLYAGVPLQQILIMCMIERKPSQTCGNFIFIYRVNE